MVRLLQNSGIDAQDGVACIIEAKTTCLCATMKKATARGGF
jgi:hypothetical protein